jgi:hypothetical protein
MPVILSKPGAISKEKQNELTGQGYVVIECDDFEAVKVVDEIAGLSGDMVTAAALEALSYGNDRTCKIAFGDLLHKRIMKRIGIEINKT